jgi:hypothetical protein
VPGRLLSLSRSRAAKGCESFGDDRHLRAPDADGDLMLLRRKVLRMRRCQVFENRDFVLLWGGETLSEVGSQSSAVAYTLLVLALTGSSTDAGIVGLARWLPLVLFSLPAGVLADRVNRKRLMIVCDLVRLVGAGSIALTL